MFSGLIVVLLLFMIYPVAIIIIPYRAIQAIKDRDHIRITPFLLLTAIYTIILLFTVTIELWLYPKKLLLPVILLLINFYMFLVIYSLYRVFRKEYEHKIEQELKQLKATAWWVTHRKKKRRISINKLKQLIFRKHEAVNFQETRNREYFLHAML